MSEIEKLEEAKKSAWSKYEKLRIPANVAYKEYEAADQAHKDAVLYEKIRRQVVRDLVNAAGKKTD